MRLRVIAVGKIKEPYFKAALQEYVTRLSPFAQVEMIELRDEPLPDIGDEIGEVAARRREAERILNQAGPQSPHEYRVALDVRGRELSSEELAHTLHELMVGGTSTITFIIGGASGLAPEITKSVNLRLSLSHLTFPHQMARVILAEQLYRAFKIMRKEPYHR